MLLDDTQTDNNGALNVDMTDLMCEMTSNDDVITTLSPTLLDFDSLSDSCVDDGLALETDDVLPDLASLEDFVDLTEFFVSSPVRIQRFVFLILNCHFH